GPTAGAVRQGPAVAGGARCALSPYDPPTGGDSPIRAQTQHSCYEGQSSEPKAVKLGRRAGGRPSVRPPRISPSCLPLRNHPRFEVVARSFPLVWAFFAPSLPHFAKSGASILGLVTRSWVWGGVGVIFARPESLGGRTSLGMPPPRPCREPRRSS